MTSKKQRKKNLKAKSCTNKRWYTSSTKAKLGSPGLYPYRCRYCFNWHNASSPSLDQLDKIMKDA